MDTTTANLMMVALTPHNHQCPPKRRIVLPAHLYDRIKASAGEHGGIGRGQLFVASEPWCVHGHAWGTIGRYQESSKALVHGMEPELARFILVDENDCAIARVAPLGQKVSFETWCDLLDVHRESETDIPSGNQYGDRLQSKLKAPSVYTPLVFPMPGHDWSCISETYERPPKVADEPAVLVAT